MFQMTKTNPFITHFSPNVTNSILYSSGHADMLVLPCSACCSFLFFLGESLPMKVRSESGEGLCCFVFFSSLKKKKESRTHDETHHTAGEKETEQERERKSIHPSPPPPSHTPSPSSSSSSSSIHPLPLTPHTPTRSGPRRHLW